MASAERVTVGVLSVLGGAFWLVVYLSAGVVADVFIGVVAVLGGVLLLAWNRLGVSARFAWIGAGTTGVAGAAAGLAVHYATLGCMYCWYEERGWPFAWLSRAAAADDPGQARLLARSEGWSIDFLRLVADFAVWAHVGLIVVVVLSLAWRTIRPARAFRPERA